MCWQGRAHLMVRVVADFGHAFAFRLTHAANGSLLTLDIEVQAVACLQGCHQGLQLRGRGRI